MRRLSLLLMLLVLSLQMGWAAAHTCFDAPGRAAGAAVQQHAVAEAQAPHDAAAGVGHGDACCASGHGCHGLHNLVAPSELALAMLSSADLPRDRLRAAFPGARGQRHERPQWSAA